MERGEIGRYEKIEVVGEPVRAFVPRWERPRREITDSVPAMPVRGVAGTTSVSEPVLQAAPGYLL